MKKWRREAEIQDSLGKLSQIVHQSASRFTQRKIRRRHIEKEAEHEGKGLIYLHAADDLERTLRELDATS